MRCGGVPANRDGSSSRFNHSTNKTPLDGDYPAQPQSQSQSTQVQNGPSHPSQLQRLQSQECDAQAPLPDGALSNASNATPVGDTCVDANAHPADAQTSGVHSQIGPSQSGQLQFSHTHAAAFVAMPSDGATAVTLPSTSVPVPSKPAIAMKLKS
ncbi:MAG: hypothetical protein O2955_03890 [Planctomycetota bacterium]|nr:hypothetical protein [Planctomycetota bacterium]MDA1211630.1 hypothetical protein [Planctomycetota bacterium]